MKCNLTSIYPGVVSPTECKVQLFSPSAKCCLTEPQNHKAGSVLYLTNHCLNFFKLLPVLESLPSPEVMVSYNWNDWFELLVCFLWFTMSTTYCEKCNTEIYHQVGPLLMFHLVGDAPISGWHLNERGSLFLMMCCIPVICWGWIVRVVTHRA